MTFRDKFVVLYIDDFVFQRSFCFLKVETIINYDKVF